MIFDHCEVSFFGQDIGLQLHDVFAFEGEGVGQHVEEGDANSPYVQLFSVHLLHETSLESFGRQEAHRATCGSDDVILILEELTDAEVTEDELAMGIYQAILGLNVSVNDVLHEMTIMDC